MAKIVIAPHAGGLGDNLVYSTLPKRLTEERGDEVWIARHPAPRNGETHKYVWGLNPYVKGVTDTPPNAGVHAVVYTFIKDCKRYGSPVMAVEAGHGLEPRNVYPEIFYEPVIHTEFADVVFADSRLISTPIPGRAFNQFVDEVCRWHDYDPASIVVLESAASGPVGGDALLGRPRRRVSSLGEYIDLIASCKAFLVAESGGQVLAATVKAKLVARGETRLPHIHALFTPWGFNDKLFTFPNVTYRVTTQAPLAGDYHPYPGGPMKHLGEVTVP